MNLLFTSPVVHHDRCLVQLGVVRHLRTPCKIHVVHYIVNYSPSPRLYTHIQGSIQSSLLSIQTSWCNADIGMISDEEVQVDGAPVDKTIFVAKPGFNAINRLGTASEAADMEGQSRR